MVYSLWLPSAKVDHYMHESQFFDRNFKSLVMLLSIFTGHQYSTSDWVHQRPQNQQKSRHHQRRDSLQGKLHTVIVVNVIMCLHTVLTGLTVLLGHGAHHSWHRGPLWTVESLLLEGQVRASFLSSSGFVVLLAWRCYCSLWDCVGTLTANPTLESCSASPSAAYFVPHSFVYKFMYLNYINAVC